MTDEQKAKLRLEIAHVLFIDIVGYSKLLIDEQSEALRELNDAVRNSEAAREAEACGQLLRLPSGDGTGGRFPRRERARPLVSRRFSPARRSV